MYKKSSEFFSTELAKKASGMPQIEQLMQQRRKASPRAPIVPMTRTFVSAEASCGPKAGKASQDQDSENHVGTEETTS